VIIYNIISNHVNIILYITSNSSSSNIGDLQQKLSIFKTLISYTLLL